MPPERSIVARVLLPVLLVAGFGFAAMLLLTGLATSKVREDYDRLAIDAAAAHVTTLLDLAVSELTAARLQANPVVIDAKKKVVVSAVRRAWTGVRLEGVILADDGRVVTTTMGEAETRAVIASLRDGFFVVKAGEARLRCLSQPFAVWGWTVVTLGRSSFMEQFRPELRLLLPLLSLGAVGMVAGVLLVLWRNLGSPIARMVAEVESDRELHATGITELDHVGAAVTSAMQRLRARTAELDAELERRRDAERTLQRREARIRLLMDSTAEGIFGMDAEGGCTFCNSAAARMLGLSSQEELLGRDVHELVHHARPGGSPYPAEECPMRRTSLCGRAARVTDDVFWRQDGTSFPVEYWSYPMMEEGELRGAVVGFVDTTERTALEQQLRQSQKMEAVGRLAGGIAHDFNNMLMAIVGHATLARESVAEGSSAQHDLDQVLSAADKAAGLTRQILAFSRKQPVRLAPVDVNDVVAAMGKVLARLLGEDVEVEYDLAPGELVALADRGQVEQIMLNIWSNARDAMPGGGRLRVTTRAADVDAAGAADLGLPAPGPYAVLAVADNGPGMDEQTRLKAFEPFFTTKEAGKGTGLGLAIAYGIVQQHRGQIALASAPGRGTTVTIHLPRVPRTAARPPPATAGGVRGGTETVLLAEDNEQVRTLARTVLEGAGYRVLVATNGEEAVALHEAHAEEIALCLFDVVMPRLGGVAALETIRRSNPGTRALLMSGYAPDLSALEGVPLLSKPFVPRELLRGVRETLDD